MFLVFVLLLINFTTLQADLLELKTGENLEGNFLGESGKFLEFEEKGIVKKIPKAQVKNLELGYKGPSFCYKKIGEMEDCNTQLFAVYDKKIIISKGKGGTIKEEIPLSRLEYFKSSNIRENDRISSVIKPKSKLQIKSRKGEWKGSISNSDFQNGNLNLQTEKDGVTVNESDIEEIYWKRETPWLSMKDFPQIAIPGIYQWPRSKILGGSMFLLLLGFGAMIPTEFNKAQAALDRDQTILVVNNRVYILNGIGKNSKFEQHKQNMNLGMLGLGLVFSYHIYDVIATKSKEIETLETKLEFHFSPSTLPDRFSPSIGRSESHYSLQITTQF